MRKYFLLCLILLGAWVLAQGDSYTFPRIKSTITVPISIPLSEVTSLINKSVYGVLYEDNSYTDNNNDQFKVRVEKDGNIDIAALKGNKLLISIPLKIWAEQGYGTLGMYMYQDTDFKVIMNFITTIETNPNWTLKTKTVSNGFDWTSKPVLDYGAVKIPISSVIESTLTKKQSGFTGLIDQKIKESFDLKPYLLLIWNNFNDPINISEDYNTWLKVSPQTVYISPLKIYFDVIKMTVGLDMYSETFIGQKPLPNSAISQFPNYQLKEQIPTIFDLKTTANVSYTDATALAKLQFLNQEFELSSEKSKVKITDINVHGEGSYIVIEAQTEGAVNGISIIKGIPYYDATKNKIALKETDFKLKTKSIFKKTIAVLFEGKIKKMIEADYGIPMQDIIQESKKNLTISFNKEYYPGIFLQGKVLDFKPSQVLLTQNHMTIVIDTQANLQLKVLGLNF